VIIVPGKIINLVGSKRNQFQWQWQCQWK
jgi:hypothetical protein